MITLLPPRMAITVLFMLLCVANYSQIPQKFNFQSVVHDNNGNVLTNHTLSARINILQYTISGESVYTEVHTKKTNRNGGLVLEVGNGNTRDNFSLIDWSDGPYFLQIEIDKDNTNNFKLVGTSQLLSVPYALYAKDVLNKDDADANPTNELQELHITGNQLSISSGNAVNIPVNLNIPVYAAETIDTLTCSPGLTVYNSTTGNIIFYNGINWIEIKGECYPKPSEANAGEDIYLSNAETSVQLNAQTPEYGEGKWKILNGDDGNISDPSIINPVFTGVLCNSYLLEWSVATRCDTLKDQIVIDFQNESVNAEAGPDQSFNDGRTTAILNAKNPASGTGTWTVVSGANGSFSDKTDPTASFTGQICESYTLKWSVVSNCNTSSDQVNVDFMHTPVDANAGDDIYISGDSVCTLQANDPGDAIGYWKIISGPAGSFSDLNDPQTTFSGHPGHYILEWTIETACQSSSDQIEVYLYHWLGESFAGGTIFWLSEDFRHGLVAADNDLAYKLVWGCYDQFITSGNGADDPDEGFQNTEAILLDCAEDSIAAKLCSEHYTVEDGKHYADWYLPAENELSLMLTEGHQYLENIKDFEAYWSSTEKSDYKATAIVRQTGLGIYNLSYDKTTKCRVRPISAF